MLPTLQFSADLFAFVKEIFYWNFHFPGSDRPTIGKLILPYTIYGVFQG